MSRSSKRDLFILAGIVCFFLLVYVCSDAVFEMVTEEFPPAVMIGTAIACYGYIFYLVYRYLRSPGDKIRSLLLPSFGYTVLLWLLVTFNCMKVPMLLGYWSKPLTHATLPILKVYKRQHKGSFNGGRVRTVSGNDTLTLDCSRTLYFALRDRKDMLVDIGRSADNRNWFVSKVYLEPGAYEAARTAYWANWRERRFPLLMIVSIFIFGVLFLLLLDHLGVIPMRTLMSRYSAPAGSAFPKTGRIILLWLSFTLLGLLLYLLFRIFLHH